MAGAPAVVMDYPSESPWRQKKKRPAPEWVIHSRPGRPTTTRDSSRICLDKMHLLCLTDALHWESTSIRREYVKMRFALTRANHPLDYPLLRADHQPSPLRQFARRRKKGYYLPWQALSPGAVESSRTSPCSRQKTAFIITQNSARVYAQSGSVVCEFRAHSKLYSPEPKVLKCTPAGLCPDVNWRQARYVVQSCCGLGQVVGPIPPCNVNIRTKFRLVHDRSWQLGAVYWIRPVRFFETRQVMKGRYVTGQARYPGSPAA